MGAQSFYIKAVATSASIAWEKELTENDSYYGIIIIQVILLTRI